jgi:hypothetical protein
MLLDGPEVVLGALRRPGINASASFGGIGYRDAGTGALGRVAVWSDPARVPTSPPATAWSASTGVRGRLRPAGASRGHDTRRLHAMAPRLVGQTVERVAGHPRMRSVRTGGKVRTAICGQVPVVAPAAGWRGGYSQPTQRMVVCSRWS